MCIRDSRVRAERRKELCFEGGHRWFDLRRYAVNELYPADDYLYGAKDIYRIYAEYNHDTQRFVGAHLYMLPAGDNAYTLAIPKSVIEFDSEMKDNPRDERKKLSTWTLDDFVTEEPEEPEEGDGE